jgi:large subunit ribosomal protein L7/L12
MAKEKKETSTKIKKLIEEIENLTLLEVSELVKILEEKFGPLISSQPAVIPQVFETEKEKESGEEKSVFSIELKSVGEKKIEVIKVVRDVTGKGLKEAKDIVDAVASEPQVLKENVKKEEAQELKKKLEAAGAKVELK